jgi:hypothetical protein
MRGGVRMKTNGILQQIYKFLNNKFCRIIRTYTLPLTLYLIPLFVVFWLIDVNCEMFNSGITWNGNFILYISALFGSLIIAYITLRGNQINEANLIKSLNNDFITNKGLQNVYKKLTHLRDNPNQKLVLDISEVNSYLNFFESISLMIKKNLFKIEDVDDLFANRFFLVANSIEVFSMRLKDKVHFENIYDLYEKWTYFRLFTKKEIIYGDPSRRLIEMKKAKKVIRLYSSRLSDL